jgi:hypothetical protein
MRGIVAGTLLALAGTPSLVRGQLSTERLYQEACDAGDASSCGVFALMLETGDGIPQDLPRAARLYERACVLGAFAGCVNLGLLYEAGTGVPQDIGRARLLHVLACQGGEPLGCERLDALADGNASTTGAASGGGRVRHAATGVPLSDALVMIGEEGHSTMSDVQGFFTIPDLSDGEYRIRVDRLGYEIIEGRVELPFDGELIVLMTPGDIVDLSVPGRIEGRVTATNGDGLRNVDISVVGRADARALTNGQGRFAISGVEAGSHEVRFALLGHVERTVALVVHPSRTTVVEAELSVEPIELEPIQVVVRSGYLERNGFYQRQRSGWGSFFDSGDIEDMVATELSDVLRRVPGVRLARNGFSTVAQTRRSIAWGLDQNFNPAGQGIFTRGAAERLMGNGRPPCTLAVYLDGVPTFDSDLDWIPVSQIDAVEVYTGGISTPIMFLWQGGQCGAVAVWTRR